VHELHYEKRFDPAIPPPPHATTLILGEPGAGKASLLRWIILQRSLQGRMVINPEGENNRLCETTGGQVVPAGISEDKDTYLIHPLLGENPARFWQAGVRCFDESQRIDWNWLGTDEP
jgi:hypothetical protein